MRWEPEVLLHNMTAASTKIQLMIHVGRVPDESDASPAARYGSCIQDIHNNRIGIFSEYFRNLTVEIIAVLLTIGTLNSKNPSAI